MNLILHSSTQTSGTIAHLFLAESGLNFTTRFISLREGDQRKPEYLAINPKGEVPALEADGTIVTEVPAIGILVADLAPASGLLPQDRVARAQAISWLCWCSFRFAGTYTPFFQAGRTYDDPTVTKAVRAQLRERVIAAMGLAGQAVTGTGYLVGHGPTLADFYLATLARWTGRMGIDMPPAVVAHRDRIHARPAVRRVFEAEGIQP